MNSIRQIQELNRRELENNVSPNASWHVDYRDTAYVYIGGLPFELSEGDVITIFSQYGEPTYINLIRDKETGKSRGFAFLKYEDQRSTDLAVDNLGGAVIMGRTLKVDHTRYKRKDDEEEQGIDLEAAAKGSDISTDEDREGRRKRRRTSESEEQRPMLKEEKELANLIQEHDEDDPMKAFLVQEKKDEVAQALARLKDGKSEKRTSHKHRHHHRSRKDMDGGEDGGKHSRHKDSDHSRRKVSRSREDLRNRDGRDRLHKEGMSESRRERRQSSNGYGREQHPDSGTGRLRGDDSGYHRSRRDQ